MEIIYLETIPDVDIYHDLRTSVGWATFSKEQSKKALMNSCHCVIAKDGNQTIGWNGNNKQASGSNKT